MTDLQRKIIDLSYKHKLTHIGSCLTSVALIDGIYAVKKENEPFILSNAHSSLALYVVLEKYYFKDAEELWKKHGTHCNRDMKNKIWFSGGSLGMGVSAAIGFALADRTRNVYLMISDGETNEGVIYESLRIAGEQKLENLRVIVNCNGWGAYGKIDTDLLEARLKLFYPVVIARTNLYDFPAYLNGQEGHYHKLTDLEYKELIK